jgi:hypothetical protein
MVSYYDNYATVIKPYFFSLKTSSETRKIGSVIFFSESISPFWYPESKKADLKLFISGQYA